ncbi:MAG: hypothetical protein QOF48_3641 [Verrucomicrobiota bacterium]|jgi:uncharacterized protein (DUF1501 family)
MAYINVLSRRDFLSHTLRTGAALGLASLTQVPPFARRALAESGIGLNGKKLLFIFLRGANDALNSLIPIRDSSYSLVNRPNLFITSDAGTNYATTGPCDFPTGLSSTFSYADGIRSGNGFAALHPSLKFLAPVYNAGDLALIHRVGYPRQSRSHFDSQAYWETGEPNSSGREGIFYRTLVESGLPTSNPLSGVSIQSGLPTLLKGSQAALTNLSDPTRYDLLGLPHAAATGDRKAMNAILAAQPAKFGDKRSRTLLELQYQNMVSTLNLFATIDFTEAGNTFQDNGITDGAGSSAYSLFPTTNAKNGGGTLSKYVVDAGAYSFFEQLKGAALILNNTDAVIAGTEMTGFDTHNNQGGANGAGTFNSQHANLLTRVGWAIYALRKYFKTYNNKVDWNNLVVVTLTEFGRTSIQNTSNGTDHAEGGMMLVAGGGVKGYQKNGRPSGIYACHPTDSIPWVTGPAGSMFGVAGRYLQRAVDYRSVLGEIIRDHLGASTDQLGRIIPGYTTPGEHLQFGGVSSGDSTSILGELDVV